jgi:hypothetical protein
MKRHLAIYVENEEFAQLRHEATQRKMSLSRYVKERLLRSHSGGVDPGVENTEFLLQTVEQRVVKAVAAAVENGGKGLAENLRTVIVMLDQLVRSTLTHLPEIPEAQKERALAAGDRRHRGWQQEVETLLRQMREQPAAERQRATSSSGAYA